MDDPDYAELGYPETEAYETVLGADMDMIARIWAGGPVWSILEDMVVAAKLLP